MNHQTKLLIHSYRNSIKTSLCHNTQTNIKTEYPLSDHLHHFNNKSFPLSPPSSDHSPFTCQDSNSDLEGGGSEEGSLYIGGQQNHLSSRAIPSSNSFTDCMGKIEEKGDCNNQHPIEKPLIDSHLKKVPVGSVINGISKYHESDINKYFNKIDDLPNEAKYNIHSNTTNCLNKFGMVADKQYKIDGTHTKFSLLDGHSKEIPEKPLSTLPMEIVLSPKSDMDPSFFTSDDISIFDDMMDSTPIFDNVNHQILPIQNHLLDTKLPLINDTHKYINTSHESLPYYIKKPSTILHDYQSSLHKKNIINKQQILEKRLKNITQRITKLQANCLLKHSKKELELHIKKRDFLSHNSSVKPSLTNENFSELVSQIKYFHDQDSDRTDSSSDDDSVFDDIYSFSAKKCSSKQKTKLNLRDNPHIWKWEQTRASIARKWIWLQHQISYLETKVNQQKDINFHLKAIKPSLKFESKDLAHKWSQSNNINLHTSSFLTCPNPLQEDSCARCRPLGHYSKRKLYPNIALLNSEASMGPLACSHYFSSNSLGKVKRNKFNQTSPTKNHPWFHSNLTESRIPLVLLYNIATRTKYFIEDINKNFKKQDDTSKVKNPTKLAYSQQKSLTRQQHKKKPTNLKNSSRSNTNNSSSRKHLYNYDIDDMAITFNASANTSIILPHFNEIITPKWKITDGSQCPISDSQEFENIDDTHIQERHVRYQLKEKSERNFFLKKRNSVSNLYSSTHNKQLKSTTSIHNLDASPHLQQHPLPHSPTGSLTSLLKIELDVSNDSKSSILTAESTNYPNPLVVGDKVAKKVDENQTLNCNESPTIPLVNCKNKINHTPSSLLANSAANPLNTLPHPNYGYEKRIFPLNPRDYEMMLMEIENEDTTTFSFSF